MIKDICVHLDGTAEDEARIAHADMIAGLFDAHLVGVFTNRIAEMVFPPADLGDPSAMILTEMIADSRRRGDEVEARLRRRCAQLSGLNELRRIDEADFPLAWAVSSLARSTDLFVMSRPWGSDEERRWPGLVEDVLFDGGRAVYLVPPGSRPAAPPTNILIGWSDSREAARALTEALPLLQRAGVVTVATVEEHGASRRSGEAPEADIARHLDRHGVTAELRRAGGWERAADGLLNEARLCGSDLLVMGAYGHSRFREWVMGGNSRAILTHCPLPVLMAH
ncbi:nucleotide-binding universal stress UspA family protein [Azospirillum agricola]|uniref:universal stress protein n=1 Tax=Azospirillum agricola TaxID=1720247 RepID=UPI001AE1FF53|nr:universal stress protein [Azospirillum agricola]MBP2233244.1 nucleotide-binding universal stress UspA family protein [Azospirillum agricola]